MKRITKIEENRSFDKKKELQVAAYCRVSTVSEEQLVSLAAQKAHYESRLLVPLIHLPYRDGSAAIIALMGVGNVKIIFQRVPAFFRVKGKR